MNVVIQKRGWFPATPQWEAAWVEASSWERCGWEPVKEGNSIFFPSCLCEARVSQRPGTTAGWQAEEMSVLHFLWARLMERVLRSDWVLYSKELCYQLEYCGGMKIFSDLQNTVLAVVLHWLICIIIFISLLYAKVSYAIMICKFDTVGPHLRNLHYCFMHILTIIFL